MLIQQPLTAAFDKTGRLVLMLVFNISQHVVNQMEETSVVGTTFIDIGDIYCFRTGLPIPMATDVYQYHHLK